jgi:peptidoglycan/xylan/chitin deacetylase (PgdA/CDA1 family)
VKELAGRAAEMLARCGFLAVLEAADRGTDRVRVLAYHRIDDLEADPDLDPGLISASPTAFRAQMEEIARRYTAITLEQLLAAHRGQSPLPPRAVLLTFDDGYQDFEHQAWPILKELGLPSVLFVPTSFPDTAGPGFWWDRLHAALARTDEPRVEDPRGGSLELDSDEARRAAHRVLRTHAKTLPHSEAMVWLDGLIGRLAEVPSLHRVLGWDALRKLAGEGLSVCSHGSSHALCTRLSPDELEADLSTSKLRIEMELGTAAPPAVIAYPANASNATVREAVRDAGYEMAFGGRRGIDRLPLRDPVEIMRMPVHRYGTALFRAQLRPVVSELGRVFIDSRNRRIA